MVLLDRASFRSSVADGQAWLLDLIRAFVGAQYREVAQILRKAEVSDPLASILPQRRVSDHMDT